MSNSTISSPTDHFADFSKMLETRSTAVVVVEAAFFLLINFATLFGNLLLCAVLLKNFTFQSITNILILALSVADILMGFVCMPLTCGALIHGRWLYDDFACKLQCFSIYFLAFVSLQTIVLTSLNRFFRVVKPAQYRRIFTVKKTVVMLIMVWICTALILAVPMLTGAMDTAFNPAKAACVIFKKDSVMKHKSYPAILRGLLLLVFAVIPTTVIFICYFKIFRAVGEHFKRVAPNLAQKGRRKSRVNSREMRTTITLFAVVVMFVLSWLPVFVIEIIQAFAIDWWNIPRKVQLLWTFFGSFSSAVNPLVYGFANPSYRREYKRVLTFKWKGKNTDNSDNRDESKSPSVAMATLNLPS